jgi:DNA repair protein RecO (recombination protein O)
MTQNVTRGIVLKRINYLEADRILTVLSSDFGKLHLIAKGVRKINSKLAGGIELFSTSNLSYINGKGGLGTLTSSRLITHYSHITEDLTRTLTTYDTLKIIDKITEDEVDYLWFELLDNTLNALNDLSLSSELIFSWFKLQLLSLSGHQPDLLMDRTGKKLDANNKYFFDPNAMAFYSANSGNYSANEIKFIRLMLAAENPKTLQKIKSIVILIDTCSDMINGMASMHLDI